MFQLGLFEKTINKQQLRPNQSPRLNDLIEMGETIIFVTGSNIHLVCVRDGRKSSLEGHWCKKSYAIETLRRSGYKHHSNIWKNKKCPVGGDLKQKSELWWRPK
jgi:hypothetical protein